MKKRAFAIAVIVICLSILATTTLAYYTTADVTRNVITSSGIAIQIEEVDADGNPYPVKPVLIMPSEEVDKVVKVCNVQRDSFIRAKIDVAIKKDGKPTDLDPSVVAITLGSEKWLTKEGDSQWLYYDKLMGYDEYTEELMTKVSFSGPGMTNEYQGCTIEVTITAQAVQADNNKTTVLEALGWPGDPLPTPDET